MTASEAKIMRLFRQYRADPCRMVFFNAGPAKAHPASFHAAMTSLIDGGLVVRERRRDAYSLTPQGYRASLSF